MNRTRYLDILQKKPIIINIFIFIFYGVGLVGFLLPISNALFLKLVPIALLLSFVLLIIFHETELTIKSLIVFTLIYILAFTIEAIGVNTGVVFGNYYYSNSLGIQLFQTPLIIGLNWLFLVYASAVIVNSIGKYNIIKILAGSAIMLIYDIVLEQIASKLDMWYWKDNEIPLQNYVSWFILALLFHSLIRLIGVKIKNKFALIILLCQSMFFVLLILLLN